MRNRFLRQPFPFERGSLAPDPIQKEFPDAAALLVPGVIELLVASQRVPGVIEYRTGDLWRDAAFVMVPPAGTRFTDTVMRNPDCAVFISPEGAVRGKTEYVDVEDSHQIELIKLRIREALQTLKSE